MCVVAFDVPDSVLSVTQMTTDDVSELGKRMLAVALYKDKGFSLGYCADVAGMHKTDFIQLLGEFGISIFQFESDEEFFEELENAERAVDLARANRGR